MRRLDQSQLGVHHHDQSQHGNTGRREGPTQPSQRGRGVTPGTDTPVPHEQIVRSLCPQAAPQTLRVGWAASVHGYTGTLRANSQVRDSLPADCGADSWGRAAPTCPPPPSSLRLPWSRDAGRNRPILVYRLGGMPIQSCRQSVSAKRGKVGAG
jgi:hypothetical protein